MYTRFFFIFAGDQDIINVRVAVREAMENLVNKPLEGLGCVPETEGHLDKFEKAKGCSYGSLGNVGWFHRYLVIRPYKVDLGKDGCAMEGCCKILNMGYRVSIRNSGVVQGSIVAAGAPVPWGLLRDHVQWGGPWTRGGTDDSQVQHVVKLLAGNLEAIRG